MIFFETGTYSFAGCPICRKYLQVRFKVDDIIIYFCHNCRVDVIFDEEIKKEVKD